MADIPYQRFWSKVDVRGADDCWEWTAYRTKDGYGQYREGHMVQAPRIAWEIAHKEELGERLACHRCNNPGCCNPAHIYAGTPKQNTADARRAGTLRSSRNIGEANPAAKLRAAGVAVIKRRLAGGDEIWTLAIEYGVSDHTIRNIRSGRTWKLVEPEERTMHEPGMCTTTVHQPLLSHGASG